MKKKTWLTGLMVVLAVSIGLNAWAADTKLNLSKGTMQLGGVTEFDVHLAIPDEGDSTSGFVLNLAPQVGYFIMDNFELFGTVNLGLYFGDFYDGFPTLLSFAVGGKYMIPMGSMVPYFGVGVGMDFVIPEEGDTVKALDIMGAIGILVPLNQWVAVDLGITPKFVMSLEDGGSSAFILPVGYLGVQAFF